MFKRELLLDFIFKHETLHLCKSGLFMNICTLGHSIICLKMTRNCKWQYTSNEYLYTEKGCYSAILASYKRKKLTEILVWAYRVAFFFGFRLFY